MKIMPHTRYHHNGFSVQNVLTDIADTNGPKESSTRYECKRELHNWSCISIVFVHSLLYYVPYLAC